MFGRKKAIEADFPPLPEPEPGFVTFGLWTDQQSGLPEGCEAVHIPGTVLAQERDMEPVVKELLWQAWQGLWSVAGALDDEEESDA